MALVRWTFVGVSLTYDHIFYHVPMFRSGEDPCGLEFVGHSEKGVCNAQAVFSAHAEKEESIVVDFSHSMGPDTMFPAAVLFAYSGLVAKENNLVVLWGGLKDLGQLLVELFLCVFRASECGGVGTDDCSMPGFVERYTELHQALVDSNWNRTEALQGAVLMAKPTPCTLSSACCFPFQKKV